MVVLKLKPNIMELMMKSKKKLLGIFNGSFLEILSEGAIACLISLKGIFKKKSIGNPALDFMRKWSEQIFKLRFWVHRFC